MSTERDTAQQADSPAHERKRPDSQLRGDWSGWRTWSEEEQAKIDIRECTDARCMNVDVNVGYQGLVHNSVLSQAAAVGDELRAAWQSMLQGEGKVNAGGKSLRETIFGAAEHSR